MKKSTTLAAGLFLPINQFSKLLLLTVIVTSFSLQAQNNFNKEKDLFIAQFDNFPDSDDIHSQAAVGSLLAHPDFQGVNYLGVAGAYGRQPDTVGYHRFIDSNSLFEIAFGVENVDWIDAHADRVVNDDFTYSADFIADKAKPILQAGGKVWVMEAGQSDITADWVAELISDGVTNTKTNVIVVQHSTWNEGQTTSSDLDYVKDNANYVQIDDGNSEYGSGSDRGDNTPDFNETSSTYMTQIMSSSNPNSFTRSMWIHANDLALNSPYNNGPIPGGGIDFSDTCEAMWIFDINHDYITVQSFIDEFVLQEANEICNVYEEINGVVAVEAEHFVSQSKTENREWFVIGDGSITPSPDPDGPNTATASGGMYLEILPDTRVTHDDPLVDGVSFTNSGGTIAVIDYKVYINNPGKYFVWVRAHSSGTEDNGIHVGLDGTWPSTGNKMQWCDGKNQWTWESKQRTDANHCGVAEQIYLDIATAGEHTISFSMREDGFEFDKFVLSKAYTKPTDEGIAEVSYDCDNGNDTNNAPTVAIDTPTNNASFEEGIDIGFNANASDSDGSIEQVEFFVNGTLLKTEKVIPYTATMSGYAEGSYSITAVATDNDGATTTSSVITIHIGDAPVSSAPIGSTIWLQAYTGNYVNSNTGSNNLLDATSSGNEAETSGFLIEDAGNGLIALKSISNTRYVAADLNLSEDATPLIANRTVIGPWEKFEWIENNNGSISLRSSANGKFVAADALEGSNRPLIANRNAIGSWERFNWGTTTTTTADTEALSPINDAYLQGATRYNANNIRVENGIRVGYLMFDLSDIEGAIETLDLEFTIFSDSGNGNVNVNLGTSNSWTETNLSTSNSPDEGVLLGSLNTTYALGNTYTISLDASKISGDSLTLILTATSGNDFDFGSKENSGTTGPKLVINGDSANKGITLTSGATIEIYPNPVVDVINFKGNVDGAVVKVYSLLGALQTEVSLESGQGSLNVSNLAPGVYIVNITNVTNGQLINEMIKAIKQ